MASVATLNLFRHQNNILHHCECYRWISDHKQCTLSRNCFNLSLWKHSF